MGNLPKVIVGLLVLQVSDWVSHISSSCELLQYDFKKRPVVWNRDFYLHVVLIEQCTEM